MRGYGEFLKATCIGGFFIILPIGLLIVMLIKLFEMLQPMAVPVAGFLPEPFRYPIVVTFVLLLLISFAAGLLALTRAGRSVGKLIETSTLNRIPGYQFARSLTHRIGEVEDTSKFAPAFVEIEEALVPAFIIEELDDGKYTVFVPSVPTLASGSIYIMDGYRVHHLDAPFMSVARCVTQYGIGSAELLKSLRDPFPIKLGEHNGQQINTNI